MSDQALQSLYERVTTWQRRTFPNQTAESILAHMWKELAEIEAAPFDVEERADMAILAMGYADRTRLFTHPSDIYAWGVGTCEWAAIHLGDQLRALKAPSPDHAICMNLTDFMARCAIGTGLSFSKFLAAISAKMDKNEARRWPAPSEQVPGQPVEHLRDIDDVGASPSQVEILRARIDELLTERAEWRANNARLRAERQRVREILGARPNEGVIEAARRVMVRPVDTNPGAALAPGEEAPQ